MDGSDERLGEVVSWRRESRGLEMGMDMLDARERLRSRVAVMVEDSDIWRAVTGVT